MPANQQAAYLALMLELYDKDGFGRLNIEMMAARAGMRPTSFTKALTALIDAGKVTVIGDTFQMKSVNRVITDRVKVAQKSAKSRAKVDDNSAKKQMKSTEFSKKTPHIKNKEQRNNTEDVSELSGRPIKPTAELLKLVK